MADYGLYMLCSVDGDQSMHEIVRDSRVAVSLTGMYLAYISVPRWCSLIFIGGAGFV